jgi:hypothetical protein
MCLRVNVPLFSNTKYPARANAIDKKCVEKLGKSECIGKAPIGTSSKLYTIPVMLMLIITLNAI